VGKGGNEDYSTFAEATALEESEAESAAQEDAPVREILEWEYLAEKGTSEEALGSPPTPPPQQFKTRRVVFKTTKLKLLKAIALELNASGYGTKQVIFNRLQDLPTVKKISDDEFKYPVPVLVGSLQKVKETWVCLDPEDVPPVAGIDMATGAAHGFFGPTNKENAVGATRTNFLTSEKIVRPEFGPKRLLKKRMADGKEPPP
jgi:hypothetical protein